MNECIEHVDVFDYRLEIILKRRPVKTHKFIHGYQLPNEIELFDFKLSNSVDFFSVEATEAKIKFKKFLTEYDAPGIWIRVNRDESVRDFLKICGFKEIAIYFNKNDVTFTMFLDKTPGGAIERKFFELPEIDKIDIKPVVLPLNDVINHIKEKKINGEDLHSIVASDSVLNMFSEIFQSEAIDAIIEECLWSENFFVRSEAFGTDDGDRVAFLIPLYDTTGTSFYTWDTEGNRNVTMMETILTTQSHNGPVGIQIDSCWYVDPRKGYTIKHNGSAKTSQFILIHIKMNDNVRNLILNNQWTQDIIERKDNKGQSDADSYYGEV